MTHVLSPIHKEKRKDLAIQDHFRSLIEAMGDNPSREGLLKTPQRAWEALQFLTSGYQVNLDELINDAVYESDMDEMVIVKNIEIYSLCEHHLLPFIGKCHVAYIPNGKVLGLSKVARIVDMFARRLQIQEKLTKEIADTMMKATNAQGVGVIIEAQHLCMMMRGVEKQNSAMTTSMMLGNFRRNEKTRAEFLNLLK